MIEKEIPVLEENWNKIKISVLEEMEILEKTVDLLEGQKSFYEELPIFDEKTRQIRAKGIARIEQSLEDIFKRGKEILDGLLSSYEDLPIFDEETRQLKARLLAQLKRKKEELYS